MFGVRPSLPGEGSTLDGENGGRESEEPVALARLRRVLLVVVAVGLVGTAVDLVLLAHYEDPLQLTPFFIICLCLLAVGCHAVSGGEFSLIVMRVAMTIAIAGAAIGMTLHYRGSMEFQLESDPSLAGFDLMMKVLRSKAPPTMAPMNLALLGLVGLASTYRDPAANAQTH
jgi:hypothetical protein